MNGYAAVVLLLASACEVSFAEPPLYRVTEIGALENATRMIPHDVNIHGTVVGEAERPTRYRDFVWSEKKGARSTLIRRDEVPIYVSMNVINDRGDVAGGVYSESKAFESGPAIVRRSGEIVPYLRGTWAEHAATPITITESGKVLGESDYIPWIWSPQTGLSRILDDFTWFVGDMNNLDQVVGGHANSQFSEYAFVYDSVTGRIRYIAPGGRPGDHEDGWMSRAAAINDAGQVVGTFSPRPFADRLPFIWSDAAGFRPLSGIGAEQTDIRPTDINLRGQVVGRFNHAWNPFNDSYFYWDGDEGRVIDLERLIDPADPLAADVAFTEHNHRNIEQPYVPKINDRGQILVDGYLKSDRRHFATRAFLLTPIDR